MQPNHRLVTLIFSIAMFLPGWSMAENAIKQVQVRKDGENVLVKIDMRDPVANPPGNWSIVDPPRLVFDFPDTQNQTGQTAQKVDTGDLKSLNLVQADQLTRLVLNLHRAASFSTEVDGTVIYVRLERRADAAGRSPSSSGQIDQSLAATPTVASGPDAVVREILFRRGEDGQGIVTLDLSDGTLPIDIQRTPTGLVVQLSDVEVPERLQNRRDTVDFATPVTQVIAQRTRAGGRLDILAKGHWFHQAHLTNNELTIEIKPIPTEDLNKLVQRGQQGQKVSINFYDAEATMVLRTLAEISAKNVMIDPSLANRKVTVNLENIPYDQALDIVMAQVGASMRIRNEVVLFGDRAVLLKRDQELADEIARANDTAPLAAETFELNYVKVADVAALISSALDAQVTSSTPAAGTNNQTTQPANSSAKGLLSARGSMTRHEATNKLFVRDTAERIDAIRQVIRSVDVPAKQVLIEARIVRADTNFNRALGMRLGYNDLSSTVPGRGIGDRIGGNLYSSVAGNKADLMSLTGQNTGGGTALGSVGSATDMINLPSSLSPTGQFAISVFNSSLTRFINLELQAAENEGRTVNISSPRVVTQNNLEAKIARGTKIPYSTASSQGTNTQFIDATLSLSVKPQIAPNGTVIMELTVTNNTPGTGSPPSIQTAELKTKVTVDNGGTVVLGGVITDDTTNSENRVPFLSDIPVVGNFFKSTQKISSKGELLVFITPRVLDGTISQSVNR